MSHNKFINKEDEEEQKEAINENEVHSEYSDQIYVGKSHVTEDLYDRNNPIVKIILLVVGGIALIGTIYYIILAVGIK